LASSHSTCIPSDRSRYTTMSCSEWHWMSWSHICRRHESSIYFYWRQRCSFVLPHDGQEDLEEGRWNRAELVFDVMKEWMVTAPSTILGGWMR
jgi:hypothetical protein